LVDQRGTGFSVPFLHCDVDQENAAAVQACVDSYEADGVDLSQYRSAVIAQDFVELRKALEIDQWNVYGASYGPIPGILYADLDPEGVRSVIFDSSTDNQVDIGLADAAVPLDFITELAVQCAADELCASRLPDIRGTFINTYRSLRDDPWVLSFPGEDDVVLEGDILFGLVRNLIALEYPAFLEIFANRDTDLLLELVGFSGEGEGDNRMSPVFDANPETRAFANLMGGVVQCAAIDVESFPTALLPTREAWPDDLIATARMLVGQDYPAFCAGGFVDIEQDLSQREPRLLSVPTLIFGGGLDSAVALIQVQKFTESFASPNVAIFPRGGHVVGEPVADLNACAKSIASDFLTDPELAPDMSCLSNEFPPFLFDQALIDSLN